MVRRFQVTSCQLLRKVNCVVHVNYMGQSITVKLQVDITGRQVAAARELLKITRAELAKAAEVGLSSVYRFEEDLKSPRKVTINAIRAALERRGIVFTNGDGPGVIYLPAKDSARMGESRS